jgi:cbb3-type cytochrome oxidase maturation protein
VELGPLIAISVALGVLAWLAFLWSVRSGQYDDPEGPKYRMLDDDDEPPPRRAPDGGPGEGPRRGTAGPPAPGAPTAGPGGAAGPSPRPSTPAGPPPGREPRG